MGRLLALVLLVLTACGGGGGGEYTAPAAAGSAVIRVTDASAQHADASVTINPAPAHSEDEPRRLGRMEKFASRLEISGGGRSLKRHGLQ